jgi:hypothetical protein
VQTSDLSKYDTGRGNVGVRHLETAIHQRPWQGVVDLTRVITVQPRKMDKSSPSCSPAIQYAAHRGTLSAGSRPSLSQEATSRGEGTLHGAEADVSGMPASCPSPGPGSSRFPAGDPHAVADGKQR